LSNKLLDKILLKYYISIMNTSQNESTPRYTIGTVAKLTGIRQDLLRAWERRYKAIEPTRTASSRRLYSDLDVERLKLIKQLTAGQRRISEVARLRLHELAELIRADANSASELRGEKASKTPPSPAHLYLNQCIKSVVALDPLRLERTLATALVELGRKTVRRDIIIPLIEAVGERWQEGSLRVLHEHMISAVLRSFIGSMRDLKNIPATAPAIIITTPVGQLHELGAFIIADIAVENGWQAIYLGPNLPAEEIAAAVNLRDADAVALSLVYPKNDPVVYQEMRKLRQYVGDEVRIVAGGEAAKSYISVLEEIDALLLDSFDDFLEMSASGAIPESKTEPAGREA
jgi:DNA-binding transcriptional MerR regulator/methylmalonyl-CoA mutase cobalamin-binding subunit